MNSKADNYAARAIQETAGINRMTRPSGRNVRTLMVTGRGGTGKSTFTALVSRLLKPPLLLCDIDPDHSLGAMLGLNLESVQVSTEAGRELPLKTLSDLTREIVSEDALLELGGGDLGVKLPALLQWYTRYHDPEFDLISMGPRFDAGDYRAANLLFELVIPAIGDKYEYVLVDSPAGLEHLNRRVVGKIDDLFIVVDPSAKSRKHIVHVKTILSRVGIHCERIWIIGNHDFDKDSTNVFAENGTNLHGQILFDPLIRVYNLAGRSLRDLPLDSPAIKSVRDLLAGADCLLR